MANALIGATGFVGGNLARQLQFDEFYHSSNIESIAGRGFELLVCAGAPAVKWLANKEPEADWASLSRLMSCLETVTAKRVILISTVDVYPVPLRVTEDSPISLDNHHSYGKHRFLLEGFVSERFPDHRIVRLPALFGQGLKKNVVYDFLHGNNVDQIDSRGRFQWYSLERLAQDIDSMIARDIRVMNFATEPVTVAAIARHAFGFEFENELPKPVAQYDFLTKHCAAWGREDGYIYAADQVLADLEIYVRTTQEELSKVAVES